MKAYLQPHLIKTLCPQLINYRSTGARPKIYVSR